MNNTKKTNYEIISNNIEIVNRGVFNDDNRGVCCIGFFDLNHKGHQQIFKKTLEIAKIKNLIAKCITFDRKPSDILRFSNQFYTYMWDFPLKRKKLNEMYPELQIIKYNSNIESLSIKANEFVQYLKKYLKITEIVIGEDFVFGNQGEGNIDLLNKIFDNENVHLIKKIDNISSTIIKEYFRKGKIEKINEMLGYNLCLKAKRIFDDVFQIWSSSNIVENGTYNLIINNVKFDGVLIKENMFKIDLSNNFDEIIFYFA